MIYNIFQYAVVAAIVAFSLWQVAKRWLLPKTAVAKPADAGCGSGGCDTCGACSASSHLQALVDKDLHTAE